MKDARLVRVCTSLLALAFPLPLSTFAQNAAEYRERAETEKSWPKQAMRSAHGMVVTDEELGSRAGVEILQKGGNAVDAAVATAFALAVVEPAAGNIGGGGFMLVRLAGGKTTFFDYREVAPERATRDMYIGADGKLDPEASTTGYKSVAVPGTVAGLELALKTYGTMKLADVMAPAIRLAEEGFAISPKLASEFASERKDLQRFSVSRRIFLKNGVMYVPGETFKQPELAATLRRIAKNGAAEFYRGETAHMLVSDMAQLGGLISLEDLANYQPKVREALHAHYEIDGHKWDVFSAPPPSSGGVAVIEALNMLEGVPLKGWDDAESVHVTAEVMRRVFADRAVYLADPDFAKVPVDGLTSPCYAKELRATIDAVHASSSKTIQAGQPHVCGMEARMAAPQEISLNDGPHTTHFSVVDAAGNAVASTFTLNDSYGSHATSSAGFLLNDEMDDFTTQPGVPNALFGLIQSEANAIAPGHRPLSSMTPTILVRDGKLSFVTGSPGGPRIISAVLLSVINWMRLGMEAQASINAPRFHHQWFPDRIAMENQISPQVQNALNAMGHMTRKIGHIGLVNAIGIDVTTGERLGAADPRDEGSAVGY
ncbi:MAG TPA: gamma-glutamyltransferase [Candidatus Dormibacteraeota bacterium]|jgi:gamma-glutamyltranspeptidase/glutathione hydrolase|nr:gamma-glutamyltransferase [Candidatus Dormibacteraeota bacterium]